eukprot:jgi/Chlat1/2236/Chrsp17S08723
MDAARLREWQQQAVALADEVRAHARTVELSRVFELVCAVWRVQSGAAALSDADARAIWEKRAKRLHQDVVSLTAERLTAVQETGGEFWDACVQLLYAGADTLEAAARERVAAEAALQAEQEQRTLAASTASQQNFTKENMELRTKVVVQQQDVQRKEQEMRDIVAKLQIALRERDGLKSEADKANEELVRLNHTVEHQTKVIATLMEASETTSKMREQLATSEEQLEQENNALHVSLNQQTKVLEKLIELNAELMEFQNKVMLASESASTTTRPEAQPASGDDRASAAALESDEVSGLDAMVTAEGIATQQVRQLDKDKTPAQNGQTLPPVRTGKPNPTRNLNEAAQRTATLAAEAPSDVLDPDKLRAIEAAKLEQAESEARLQRRPIVYTSAMLLQGSAKSAETATPTPASPAAQDVELDGGIFGKARGLLSYMAGEDKLHTSQTPP